MCIEGAAAHGPVGGTGDGIQTGELATAQDQPGVTGIAQGQAQDSVATENVGRRAIDLQDVIRGVLGIARSVEVAATHTPTGGACRGVEAGEVATAQDQPGVTGIAQGQGQGSVAAEDVGRVTRNRKQIAGGGVLGGPQRVESAARHRPVGDGGGGVQAGQVATGQHQSRVSCGTQC